MAPLDLYALDNVDFCFESTDYGVETYSPEVVIQKSKQTKKSSSIRFELYDTVHEIISRKDYTKEEIESSWYTGLQMKEMRDEVKSIAYKIDTTSSSSDDDETLLKESNDFTFRGVQCRTNRQQIKKLQNRSRAYATIFIEQEMLQEDGLSDPELLADCYFDCTQQCAIDAHQIGLQDQLDAINCYTIEV